ncbi:kinase-like domain-containing protein [Trichoderma longibrachiatum]
MPTSRKRPANSQASSSSQPDSAHVNENIPREAVPEQDPAAETEIHAQSVDESTQLATAVLLRMLAEELPKAASIRPDDGSGKPTELNTNTPKQAVEESTQLASTLPQGSLKEPSQLSSSRPQETQQPTNSALRFLASSTSAETLTERRLAKTETSQPKKSAQDLENVTRQLLNNAAISLPDARLVIAYTRYSIPEDEEKDSAMICLQKIPGRGDMFGVVQTSTSADFPINLPYCPRPVDEGSDDSVQFRIDCRILYDPMSDNCLLINKAVEAIYLVDLNLQAVRTCLREKEGRVVRPGIWTISVDTRERDRFTENRLVEFLLLSRRFTVSSHGVIEQAADDRAANDEREAKRQKLDDGKMKSRKVQATDPSRKQTEHLSIAESCSTLPAPREIVNRAVVPLLDLADGETAVIHAPEINFTDPMEAYRLQRIQEISNRRAAGVFTCQRSGVSKVLVAKVLCCPKYGTTSGLRSVIDMWMQEKAMLDGLEHKNIVSLKGVDARFLAIYLECLPSSLRWGPRSPPFRPSDAKIVLCDISSALAYLFRRGIVHNDIKPPNITYSANRGAVLIDFGMAASITDSTPRGGTPHFVPPEYVDEKVGTRGQAAHLHPRGEMEKSRGRHRGKGSGSASLERVFALMMMSSMLKAISTNSSLGLTMILKTTTVRISAPDWMLHHRTLPPSPNQLRMKCIEEENETG